MIKLLIENNTFYTKFKKNEFCEFIELKKKNYTYKQMK